MNFAAHADAPNLIEIEIEVEVNLEDDLNFVFLKDKLAVTRKEKLRDGDEVVVDYKGTIYAGTFNYDRLLNIFIVEFQDDEPLLLSKEEAKSMRKVVGYCSKENDYKFETETKLGLKNSEI